MANYKTQAINLKTYNLGESDKIIVIYSRDHGIIKCVAKGVKKATSKLGGRMQVFNANKIMLAKGRNLDIVCQAESLANLSKINQDLNRLSYACYCIELVSHFGTENDPNSDRIYDILLETLKNISIFNDVEEIIWAVLRFKLIFAELLGYAVELETCVRCNSQEKEFTSYHYFCSDAGGVICSKCGSTAHKLFEIDKRYMKIFKDAINYDFPFEKEHSDKHLLFSSFHILKEFICRRSDKKLKSPEIIEMIC